MSSADFINDFVYGWTVGVPANENAEKSRAVPTTASIIDDLASIHESRDTIPRSEISIQPSSFLRSNPSYVRPSASDESYVPQVATASGFGTKPSAVASLDSLLAKYAPTASKARPAKRRVTKK